MKPKALILSVLLVAGTLTWLGCASSNSTDRQVVLSKGESAPTETSISRPRLGPSGRPDSVTTYETRREVREVSPSETVSHQDEDAVPTPGYWAND